MRRMRIRGRTMSKRRRTRRMRRRPFGKGAAFRPPGAEHGSSEQSNDPALQERDPAPKPCNC
eukprot:3117224-Pyramimonas_sp.AAC.1